MPDYIHQENNVRLRVWETNKGWALGLCKWGVWRWLNKLEVWQPVKRGNYPQVYDEALAEGQKAYDREVARQQASHMHKLSITPEAKAGLMNEFGLTEDDFYTEDDE